MAAGSAEPFEEPQALKPRTAVTRAGMAKVFWTRFMLGSF
jgi:hypothetical protein